MVFWEHLTVPGHEALLPQRGDVRPLLLAWREPFWGSQQYHAVSHFIITVIIWGSKQDFTLYCDDVCTCCLNSCPPYPFSYYKHCFCSSSIPMQSSLPLSFLLLKSLCFSCTGLPQQFVLSSCIKWHGICAAAHPTQLYCMPSLFILGAGDSSGGWSHQLALSGRAICKVLLPQA